MTRTNRKIAGFALCLVLTAAVYGQQESSSLTSTRADGVGGVKILRSRTESAGRATVTETVQATGPDGRLTMASETITETVHVRPDLLQTKRDFFSADVNGARRLVQMTESEEATSADGSSRLVESTWSPDANGRFDLAERRLQETKSEGANVKQTDTSIFRPSDNEAMRETERVRQVERQASAAITQIEASRLVRDLNGGWTTAERRDQEVRVNGVGERIEDETIRRLDGNGVLAPSERNVTRRSVANGQEQFVTESFEALGNAFSSPLTLTRRVTSTTQNFPDGGSQTTRDVESLSPGAPGGPLRVVERTIETLRSIGADRWEIQRQLLILDVNGRLSPVTIEVGESKTK